jgi:hypothetical protein
MRGKDQRRKTNQSVIIQVDAQDARRLNQFFRHELAFYNTLVGAFESRVRAFPDSIVAITPAQTNLFCDLARHNLHLQDLLQDPSAWPKLLLPHRSVVFNKQDKVMLSEALVMIMNSVGRDKWVLIPEAKQQMARSVIDFFREQAEILSHPQRSDVIEIAYRVPPSNLSAQDIETKRHVQIPKSAVVYRWNHEMGQTEMQTPYTVKPIVIPHYNLNEYNGWTNVIIKQENGRWVDYNTPWIAEFKDTGNRYLPKYYDSLNRHSSR